MAVWSPLVLVVVGIMAHHSEAAMSMQAFKQAKSMMEGICQPRTGVDKEFLTQMRRGEFPDTEDRKLRCYFECILRMGNVMKGSKISAEALGRVARTMLPTQLKSIVQTSIQACQHIDEGEACNTAYAFVKCHHSTTTAEISLALRQVGEMGLALDKVSIPGADNMVLCSAKVAQLRTASLISDGKSILIPTYQERTSTAGAHFSNLCS